MTLEERLKTIDTANDVIYQGWQLLDIACKGTSRENNKVVQRLADILRFDIECLKVDITEG